MAQNDQPDVVFLTDRNDEGGADWRSRFGSRLLSNWKLTCGRAIFRATPWREVGDAFARNYISVPQDDVRFGADDCVSLVLTRARAIRTRSVLVLVHGFNNSFADALARARAFAEDIQFKGLVVVWAWPSQGWFYGYEDDEKAAGWTTDHFTQFMQRLLIGPSTVDVDFVAHSMGNRILLEMATVQRSKLPEFGGAYVFAAPDVAEEEFLQKVSTQQFQTLYASADDRALQVSARYFHAGPRAGSPGDKGILIMNGVESIDAILRGHSYVYEDPRALRDLARLVNAHDRASLRGLTERFRGGDRYWVINP